MRCVSRPESVPWWIQGLPVDTKIRPLNDMDPYALMDPKRSQSPVSMPTVEARRLAEKSNTGPYDVDIAMKLAWRPAWSIRSRRGAWTAFKAFLKGRPRS